MPTHNPYQKSNSGTDSVNSPVPEAAMMNNPSEEIDVSNVDHATGRAKKTQGGDGAAIRLFEFWLKVVKQKVKWKIDEITSKQIENTHLQSIIVEFVHWLVETNIPKNCGHRMNSTKWYPPKPYDWWARAYAYEFNLV